MSGYGQSPDYGGWEPGPHHLVRIVLLAAAIAFVIWGFVEYSEWTERTGGLISLIVKRTP